jgi:hypothetical protein
LVHDFDEGLFVTMVVDAVCSQEFGSDLVSGPDWNSVCTDQHNVLVEGAEPATEYLLTLLAPHLRAPVIRPHALMPLALPTGACGALVLTDVSALSGREQAVLLRWLDARSDDTQVVSTTVRPLFPLVALGHFDAALYYRLNTMLVSADSGGAWA